ncbi:hypothetical protein D3A96_09740 [Robertkochia marina]|nr:hypothetical protein D3A96_09740 [Robertkochia marina]
MLCTISCKNEVDDEALEKERQKADSLLQASINNRKRLETEEELAERVRRVKNNSFTSGDSVYSEASVIAIEDSLLTGVKLTGKSNQGGRITHFTHTAITYNGKVARGILPGELFRTDLRDQNKVIFYVLEKDSGEVSAQGLEIHSDTLELLPAPMEANYYFDLLTQRQFESDLPNPNRFFKTIKSARLNNTFVSDSVFPGKEVYTDHRPLLPDYLSVSMERLWVVSQNQTANVLVTYPTDSTYQVTTLRAEKRGKEVNSYIKSAFVNDTLFLQHSVRDSLVYDHPHLVVYQKDSVIRHYRYDRNFTFDLIKTDSVRSVENYPQYYRQLKDSVFEIETDTFRLNGKQLAWKYTASYHRANPLKQEVAVRVQHKDLVDPVKNRLIFRLPQAGTPGRASLTDLITREKHYKQEDLNFDGYTDFSFKKGTDNNGNPEYIVYLYNPDYGRFSRTPSLDGISILGGIITDKEKQRLLYPGFIGNGHLSVSVLSSAEGAPYQKEIYWTTGKLEALQLHYQKIVNNSIVEKQSPLIDSLPVSGSDLKTGLVQWILEKG